MSWIVVFLVEGKIFPLQALILIFAIFGLSLDQSSINYIKNIRKIYIFDKVHLA